MTNPDSTTQAGNYCKDCRKGGIESSTVSGKPCDICGAVPSKSGFLKDTQATLEDVREHRKKIADNPWPFPAKRMNYVIPMVEMSSILSLVEAQAKRIEELEKLENSVISLSAARKRVRDADPTVFSGLLELQDLINAVERTIELLPKQSPPPLSK